MMKPKQNNIHYPLYLHSLREERLEKGESLSYGFHHASLFIVTEGELTLFIGKKPYTLCEDQGICLAAEKNIFAVADLGPVDYTVCSFFAADPQLLFGISDMPFYRKLGVPLGERIKEFKKEAMAHSRFSQKSSVTLYRFLARLAAETEPLPQDGRTKAVARRLAPAFDHIHEHYAEDIVMAELAPMCGISQTYFWQLFRLVTGGSAIAYLRQYRLKKATQLLRHFPQMSEQEIAKAIGVEYNYFLQIFRKAYGISPKYYRRQNGKA